MLAQKSWQSARVMKEEAREASRRVRRVAPSVKQPRGVQGPEVGVGAVESEVEARVDDEEEKAVGRVPGIVMVGLDEEEEVEEDKDGVLALFEEVKDEVEEVDEVVEVDELADELDGAVVDDDDDDDLLDELKVVELLVPPPNPNAYRLSRLPAPQNSDAFPLHGILHSVATVGTLPAPNAFPQ